MPRHVRNQVDCGTVFLAVGRILFVVVEHPFQFGPVVACQVERPFQRKFALSAAAKKYSR